jgi:CRISPR-associated protein Csx3
MVNLLPAILFGGPPHAGKSVLFYSLTKALRERGVPHHAIRACPDGEGNWSQEAEQETVRLIRIKGSWTDTFVQGVCKDLERRHLPMLVDMGGRPEEAQICILRNCTHSLLLLRADREDYTQRWLHLVAENGLLPLAQLYSEPAGTPILSASEPIVEGTLTGLERGSIVQGPLFDALLERIISLFTYSLEELEQAKFALAPTELTLNLQALLKQLSPQATVWEPAMLSQVLDDIPSETAISVYGPAPHWLYSALAIHAGQQEFYQFDPRLGWILPPSLRISSQTVPEIVCSVREGEDATTLTVEIANKHLDYLRANDLPFPPVPIESGLILNGSMPSWLVSALVRLYKQSGVAWIACYQPKLSRAVVVTSRILALSSGNLVSIPEVYLQQSSLIITDE